MKGYIALKFADPQFEPIVTMVKANTKDKLIKKISRSANECLQLALERQPSESGVHQLEVALRYFGPYESEINPQLTQQLKAPKESLYIPP